jgi:hypothetical protein
MLSTGLHFASESTRPYGDHLPDVPRADAQAHDPDRHVRRRRQGLSGPIRLSQAALARQSARRGLVPPRHHARLLYASEFQPYRLEYDSSQWPVDANLPEREIHLSQGRVRSVGGGKRAWRGSAGLMEGALPGNSWSYNCRPIVEAGQARLVDDTFQLDDNFTLIPTPGHSPCHCCVMIRSQGQEAIVIGDMMHHALQCREPDWSTIFDTHRVQAARSRRCLLGQVAKHRHIRPDDPFSQPDHRLGFCRRRPFSLYVRAVEPPFSLREKVASVARRMRDLSTPRRAFHSKPAPQRLSWRGVGQKYPTVVPRIITTASARRPPTIDTMTMSR